MMTDDAGDNRKREDCALVKLLIKVIEGVKLEDPKVVIVSARLADDGLSFHELVFEYYGLKVLIRLCDPRSTISGRLYQIEYNNLYLPIESFDVYDTTAIERLTHTTIGLIVAIRNQEALKQFEKVVFEKIKRYE